MWNSFPDYVVMSDTINTFKTDLMHIGNTETYSISLSYKTYTGTRD